MSGKTKSHSFDLNRYTAMLDMLGGGGGGGGGEGTMNVRNVRGEEHY